METLSYLDEEGCLSPKCPHAIPQDVLIRAYQTMLLARHIDERMITLQRQGAISFAMSALGEECCAVGAAAALEPGDWIYPQYREAGAIFWRGFTPLEYIHHMFGDAEDLILGRQMPNHFGSRRLNVVTVSSPIGTKIPHAAGCAYAMKLQKDPHVALCFFGEGATSEGDFHAGLNFAAVRQAPAIFFCRNNGYAISTSTKQQFASEGIAPKAIGYGMQAFRIDGNDFFAVHEAVAKARTLCLEGKGPLLIEAMTYRLGAHSTSDDPSVYRKAEEVSSHLRQDPVLRLRKYLISQKWWDDEKEAAYASSIQEEVTQAIERAKGTPRPPLASIIEHVYFEPTEKLINQLAELRTFFPKE